MRSEISRQKNTELLPLWSGGLTICMENPEIPGRLEMEQFIPVEIFRKKSNVFRARENELDHSFLLSRYYLFPVFTETT